MAYFSDENYEKNSFEHNIDEENVILTLVPVNEQPIEEYEIETTVSPPAEVKPKRRKAPILPLPTTLPPINEVHRDTLRNWCQQCRLSSDGQKVAVYQRLQKHAFFDSNQSIPDIPKNTRLQTHSRRRTSETKKTRVGKSSTMEKEIDTNNIVHVTSTVQEATMAAWGRIAARASLPKNANSHPIVSLVETFLPKASGIRWCTVHGKPISADTDGWVRLQCHVGQVWVPNTPRRMIPLFLLPAGTFSSPDLEDNLLCPECVKRNKKMMKSLIATRGEKQPASSIPVPFLLDGLGLNYSVVESQ